MRRTAPLSGGVPGGHASSRMATLLPIFRNFLLITIGVIAALVVLSRLGVDIGPLLAGAGVVGLAVGFGAQTLVKDIISGAFFLMDDAFRIGEYIDIGSGKGNRRKNLGPLDAAPASGRPAQHRAVRLDRQGQQLLARLGDHEDPAARDL